MRRLTTTAWFWLLYLVGLVALLLVLSGCVTQPRSHNKYGGYIEACGDLPPLVGDDC